MCVQCIGKTKLESHSAEFEKQVIKLNDYMYTAIGYSASNVAMILTDEGLVIVDCTEGTVGAANIMAEFRKITDLPVHSIIYTHSHRDHIGGASIFAAEGVNGPDSVRVYARDILELDIMGQGGKVSPQKHMLARTKRQFGFGLVDKEERINLGVGPSDRPVQGMGQGFVPPTDSVTDQGLTITVGGVEISMLPAPGETNDHIAVWCPEEKVLFPGDNYYKAFPNLYAIRGTVYRDYDKWADTLEMLAELGAETMSLGHTLPVYGKDTISTSLNSYAAAIRSVIAQTVEAMNAGKSIDAAGKSVKLPADLAAREDLVEYYGHVEWSAKAYYTGTVGWYDGNPVNLFPTDEVTRAERLIAMSGGADTLLELAQKAQAEADPQWAMELAEMLILTEQHLSKAKDLKIASMRTLADQQVNATARNYYLRYAKEMLGELE